MPEYQRKCSYMKWAFPKPVIFLLVIFLVIKGPNWIKYSMGEKNIQMKPENVVVVGPKQTKYSMEEKNIQLKPENVVVVDEKQHLSFVPPGLKNCEDLFKNGTGANLNFSSDYYLYKKKYESTLDRVYTEYHLRRKHDIEGNSGSLKEQSLTYFILGQAASVKTVCETGFNAGHSTFTFLSANPNIHVYSFDLGIHRYARPMAKYLKEIFGGRLTVTWGSSDKTVPTFIKANPDVKCDIVIVDGGHDYGNCKSDLKNLRGLARRKYHLLIIDDYPIKKYLQGVKKAWEEELSTNQLQEHFKCSFYSRKSFRGFTVGKYINL